MRLLRVLKKYWIYVQYYIGGVTVKGQSKIILADAVLKVAIILPRPHLLTLFTDLI